MDVVKRYVKNYGEKIATLPHIDTAGRLLFASSFFLSAWQEYNELTIFGEAPEGYWRPRFGYSIEQVKRLVAVGIVVKGLGGLLFIYGSFFGAYLLLLYQAIATPVLHDFYNHSFNTEELSLLFLKFKTVLNETVSYETLYNYYKSDFDEKEIRKVSSKFTELMDHAISSPALSVENEFNRRLMKFIQGLGILGSLLFFVALKHKLDRVKKAEKVKTE